MRQGIITATGVLPDATYYGLDMLRKHQRWQETREFSRSIASEHICTTAVLRLLEAGIGKEDYYMTVNKVIAENPELTHGLPIIELTHAITQDISNKDKYSLETVPSLNK